MNMKMASGFAFKNLKANRHLEIPFILSAGIMLILFNIMSALTKNEYVLTRHKDLSMFMGFGIVVSVIFTFIFVVYANRFLVKRRNKEFALYGILGLEKRHIRKITLIEHIVNYSLIALLGIGGGYVFGKLAFLGLNRIMGDVAGRSMDYPFSFSAMSSTLIFVAVLFVVIFVLNTLAIKNSSPIELLSKDHKGEGEPKYKIISVLMGLSLLGAGYGIALTVTGTLRSLGFFLIATILVIFATYILFVSFSVFVLKLQKNNKGFYYKDRHFLSISGMLYRMKSGAVGLASVTVLSTGVIIALSTTMAIYKNIDHVADTTLRREYELNLEKGVRPSETEKAREKLLVTVEKTLGNQAKNVYTKVDMVAPVLKKGNKLLELKREEAGKRKEGEPVFVIFTSLRDYNAEFKKEETLKDGEILISSNAKRLLGQKEYEIGGKVYQAKEIENIIAGNLGVEFYAVIVKEEESLSELGKIYRSFDYKKNEYRPPNLNVGLGFDSVAEDVEKKFDSASSRGMYLASKKNIKKEMYELNGGFLFLGIIIGLLFLSGTVLITYYKQVSEGIEDREKYAIMKRVGLPDELIRKTAASQVLWLFFMPLLVALLHSFAASKIIFQLLGLFGLNRYVDYAVNLGIVGLVFSVIYFINFKVTSNVYYKHVR